MKQSEKKELQLQLNETPVTFSLTIHDMVKERKCSFVDAILIYCKENDVEPEYIRGLISSTLKAKLAEEAEALNLIKKQYRSSNKLPGL